MWCCWFLVSYTKAECNADGGIQKPTMQSGGDTVVRNPSKHLQDWIFLGIFRFYMFYSGDKSYKYHRLIQSSFYKFLFLSSFFVFSYINRKFFILIAAFFFCNIYIQNLSFKYIFLKALTLICQNSAFLYINRCVDMLEASEILL